MDARRPKPRQTPAVFPAGLVAEFHDRGSGTSASDAAIPAEPDHRRSLTPMTTDEGPGPLENLLTALLLIGYVVIPVAGVARDTTALVARQVARLSSRSS
jgi:hypothetical protein